MKYATILSMESWKEDLSSHGFDYLIGTTHRIGYMDDSDNQVELSIDRNGTHQFIGIFNKEEVDIFEVELRLKPSSVNLGYVRIQWNNDSNYITASEPQH